MGARVSSLERNIVLLGKTGDGKSILRKNIFTPVSSPNSAICTCLRGKGTVYGRKLTVIDTPGVFDTARDDQSIRSEVIRAIVNCAAGVHAFVIVLKVERFTAHVEEAMDQISRCFGEQTLNHAVVLFTHGEQLNGETFEEFVGRNPRLQQFVDRCGGRCHVIDNKYWNKCLHCSCSCGYRNNRTQVKHLLETIDDMVQENGYYTNEMLRRVRRIIEEEMRNRNADNASPDQQRERAKRIVYNNLLWNLAGASSGALTGWLMGISTCVSGLISGATTGWDAANHADSLPDAVIRGAAATYFKGRHKISFIYNPRAQRYS